jgi:hypothetical protein
MILKTLFSSIKPKKLGDAETIVKETLDEKSLTH